MKIDVISIFPEYLAALDVSLPGKAKAKGLVEVEVHDLRTWTHDRHRSVDDTPYGGGAGMVMKPEPWGEALDAVAPPGATLIVPTPGGEVFTQQMAEEFATLDHLVFACGRYEGIDQRVLDEAASAYDVREVSLGDYVLNGGEVAALAIIEATLRLIPGFMGNADSLTEESHAETGLLEYPVYTKPQVWRGREVPEILLSGHHPKIAAWRHAQAVARTQQRRPELLRAETLLPGDLAGLVRPAIAEDAAELVVLQRACWVEEGRINDDWKIPALTESPDDVAAWIGQWDTAVIRAGGRIVGAVRMRLDGQRWEIGRLMVAPDLRDRGLGRWLLEYAEAAAPTDVTAYTLVTGRLSQRNLRLYAKAGYRIAGDVPGIPKIVELVKKRRPQPGDVTISP